MLGALDAQSPPSPDVTNVQPGADPAVAWGWNESGQLGDASTERSDAPVKVTGLPESATERVTAISAGGAHSLALLSNGKVMAWGDDEDGQLGNGHMGTGEHSDVPVNVSSLTGVSAISAGGEYPGGEHSLALVGKAVYAWGANEFGQLGDGSTNNSDVPVKVTGLPESETERVTAISAGGHHSLALLSTGKVMAWGDDEEGQLGNGHKGAGEHGDVPVGVTGLLGINGVKATAISAGGAHSLAIAEGSPELSGSAVLAWGSNAQGQLGDGETGEAKDEPVVVCAVGVATPSECVSESKVLKEVKSISAGGFHSLALLEKEGKVVAWGDNEQGQLGDGHMGAGEHSDVPVNVSSLTGVGAISAGGLHSLALEATTAYAWGYGEQGQLGDGKAESFPVPEGVAGSGLTAVTAISAGGYHSLALGTLTVPTVTKVEPKNGPEAGGTKVTITGTNLLGATEVRFGSTKASKFEVKSATEIEAESPTHVAETVDVRVFTPAGESTENPPGDQFTYLAPPTVTRLQPEYGPESGGTKVTITGTNLIGDTAVKFGGTAGHIIREVSSTELEAESPAHSPGPVEVCVTAGGGTGCKAGAFTYVAPPTVTAVRPDEGPETGGTTVTITGTNLIGDTAMKFGGTAGHIIREVSSTELEAESPAHSAGPVEVCVTAVGGTGCKANAFTYVLPGLTVTNVQPNAGPASGGTVTMISGTGLTAATKVSFGPKALTRECTATVTTECFNVASSSLLKAVSPPGTGTVDVTVTTPGGTSATSSADQFSYRRAATAEAWGSNGQGQVGDGTTIDRSVPVDVNGLGEEVMAFAAGGGCNVCGVLGAGGDSHSLALLKAGTVWAWGDNEQGALGDGTTAERREPVEVCAVGETKRPCEHHLEGVTAISAGRHSLALKSGKVLAWGANEYGQLGNDTTTSSEVPVEVCEVNEPTCTKHLEGVTAIAAGGLHSLVLKGGKVYAWGWNGSGQLGDETTTNRSVPVEVKGLPEEVVAIAASRTDSYALLKNGTVLAWGYNDDGQLGDGIDTGPETGCPNGSGICSRKPVAVHSLTGVTAITADNAAALALLSSGKVEGWGGNKLGQLGDGTVTERLEPVEVKGLSEATAVSASLFHSLALLRSGTVKAWGDNEHGQLGDGTSTGPEICGPVEPPAPENVPCSTAPVAVSTLKDAALVAVGWNQSLTAGPFPTVTNVQPNVGPPGGGTHVVITGTGFTGAPEVKFGPTRAASSEVNSETSISAASPAGGGDVDVTVTTAAGISATSAADQFRYGSGALGAWGANDYGQLGDATDTGPEDCESGADPCSLRPVGVSGQVEAAAVAGGSFYSLARLENGKVMAWGDNEYGELGDGNTEKSDVPVEVTGLTEEATAISAGQRHGLALLKSGKVMAWGNNGAGELGDGSKAKSDVPVLVCTVEGSTCKEHPLEGISAISADLSTHSLAVKEGKVYAWGNGEDGQLGDGSTENRDVPVQVSGLSEVAAIAAGGSHSLALLKSGKVMAWGLNEESELGHPNTGPEECGASKLPCSKVPVEVPGLSEVTAIAGGGRHSLALLESGKVMAWGFNGYGQLGDGKTGTEQTYNEVPTAVCTKAGSTCKEHTLGEVTAISASGPHSFALLRGGKVMAWGDNEDGELGNGAKTSSDVPVPVSGLIEATTVAAGGEHTLALGLSTYAYSLQVGSGAIPGLPTDVALNSEGDIWVSSWETNKVEELKENGELIRSIGTLESPCSGKLEGPWGLALDSAGNLWVTDLLDGAIRKFSPEGKCLLQVAVGGAPRGIAIDAHGNVWVSGTASGCVQELSSEGVTERQVGCRLGGGAWTVPGGLAIDPHGHIWLADIANSRVIELGEAGEYLGQIGSTTNCGPVLCLPWTVTTNASGHIFVSSASRIDEFSEGGELLLQLGGFGSGAGEIEFPLGLAVDSKGNLWVADTGNKRVEKWVPAW